MQKNCAYCGQPFDAKGRGRFCSDSHRVMGYRQKKGLPLTPFKSGQGSASLVEKLEQEVQRLKADKELNQKDLFAASSIIQGYQMGRQKDPKLVELANSFVALYPIKISPPESETVVKSPKKTAPPKNETSTDIPGWLEAFRKK